MDVIYTLVGEVCRRQQKLACLLKSSMRRQFFHIVQRIKKPSNATQGWFFFNVGAPIIVFDTEQR
jgi:hypothetical protein